MPHADPTLERVAELSTEVRSDLLAIVHGIDAAIVQLQRVGLVALAANLRKLAERGHRAVRTIERIHTTCISTTQPISLDPRD